MGVAGHEFDTVAAISDAPAFVAMLAERSATNVIRAARDSALADETPAAPPGFANPSPAQR